MTTDELNKIKEAREACAKRAEGLQQEADSYMAKAEPLLLKAEIAQSEADSQRNTVMGWDSVLTLLGE